MAEIEQGGGGPGAGAERPRSKRRRGYGGGGRRRGSARRGLNTLVHARWFDRATHVVVGVAALIYLMFMIGKFHTDTYMIGFRPVGAPQSEILYGFGRPTFVSSQGGPWTKVADSTSVEKYDVWRYAGETGGDYLMHFAANGFSDEVTCFQKNGDRGACPGLLWIEEGDYENRIGFELGSAPVRALHGTTAVLRFPATGLEFELEQYKIRRLTIRSDRASIPERIPSFIRFAIP